MYELNNLPAPVVVFEIDNPTAIRNARFSRFLSDQQILGKMSMPFEMGYGRYKGQINGCFVMGNSDFHALLNRGLSQYVEGQECIMLIDHKHRAKLLYPDSRVESMGRVHRITNPDNRDFTLIKSGFYTVE